MAARRVPATMPPAISDNVLAGPSAFQKATLWPIIVLKSEQMAPKMANLNV